MMQLSDSHAIRDIQLEIMDDIHQFCSKHNLRYSLTGGTLIGAIRHQGYIPWDDDIDIMLPRPDYELFLKEYKSEDNYVIDLMSSDKCVETFAKVCRKGTLMVDELGRGLWGINVDIFPVDGFPADGTREHFDQLNRILNRLGVFCPFYKTMSKNRFLWLAKFIIKRIIHIYPHSFLHLKKELTLKLKQYPFKSSALAALYCGGDGWREILPKEIFETYTDVTFEQRSYKAISGYDTYLSSVFGDYMQLPPVSERIPKHNYNYYLP